MELTSNQVVVEAATTVLTDAIANSNLANWIGYSLQTFLSDPLNLQTDAVKLQTALDIVAAIEAGNFTLSDLFLAAQSKTVVEITDIAGEPNPILSVLGHEFEIGSLLGDDDR